MSVWGFIGVLLAVGVFLILGLIIYMQQSFKKAVIGKVLCTFRTASNQSYDVLLPVEGNLIIPPEGHILEGNKKADKLGFYIVPSNAPTVSYPLWGWPQAFRAEVRRAFYVEGNPNPIQPPFEKLMSTEEAIKILAPKKDEAQIPVTSLALRKLIKNEASTRIWKGAGLPGGETVGGSGIKPVYLWSALGAIGLAVIVVGILAFLAWQESGSVTGWLGL